MARKVANTTDYLECNTAQGGNISNLGRWTVSAWVYAQSSMSTGPNPIFTAIATGSDIPICLGVSYVGSGLTPAGRWFIGSYEGGSNDWDYAIDTAAHEVGQWIHLVGQYDSVNTQHLLYKNGVFVSSGAVSPYAPHTGGVRVGRRWNETAPLNNFDGLIQDLCVWDGVLDSAEITRLYKGELPSNIRPQRLMAYWPMSKNGTELDRSPNAAHLTEVAGAVPVYPGLQLGGSFELLVPTFVPDVASGDEGTVYIHLQPSSTDIEASEDSATVYLDLQPSAIEGQHREDSATVYLDLTVLGGECYGRFHFTGEGEADARWGTVTDICRWSGDDQTRWSALIEVQPGCE